MESHPSQPNKACDKIEFTSKNHQEVTLPSDMRGGNGSFQLKKRGKSIDSPMQTKTPMNTVTPSTPTTLAAACATESVATSRELLVPAGTASSITSTTTLTTNIPENKAVGIIQGTKLTAGTSEHKIKYSKEGELTISDNLTSQISSFKNVQNSPPKTPPGVVRTRTALPKSVQQANFSQISMSSPKLRSNPTPTIAVNQAETFCKGRSKEMAPLLAHSSMQPLRTTESKVEMPQQNNDDEKKRERKEEEEEEEEEGIHKDIQVGCNKSDIPVQIVSKYPMFSVDRLELSPGATTTFASQLKEAAGKTDENAMSQEKECEREKISEWKECMEERIAIGKRGGHKGKVQGENREEKINKEKKGKERNSEVQEKEREEREMEESMQEKNQIKSFKDVAVMTEMNPVSVQTLDAALQTELLYVDAEIQAVAEVSSKSTTMSPSMTHPSSTPYKSSISSKPTVQHVCQIQIELCSQSTLSDSLPLPEEKDSQASSTRSGLEKVLKQVEKEGDQAGTGPLQEVAWDEQGMTWEVYGAAVDMESLGFAIQNHLQRKIREHEQRIGHLRKSFSLSQHSNGDGKGAGKKKKKNNVFRSLFQTPRCCLKTESEA